MKPIYAEVILQDEQQDRFTHPVNVQPEFEPGAAWFQRMQCHLGW